MAEHDKDQEHRQDQPTEELRPKAERPGADDSGAGDGAWFEAPSYADSLAGGDAGRDEPTRPDAGPTRREADPRRPDESAEADSNDDWFWWTDGEETRHVSEVPLRPDVAPAPAFARGDTALDMEPVQWSSGGWTTAPPPGRHRRQGRAATVVAAIVASAVLIASGVGIGWGLSQGDQGSQNAIVNPPQGGNDGIVGGGGTGDGGNTDGQVPPEGQVNGIDPEAVASQVGPAVVVIETVIGSGAPGDTAEGGASGTGMIVTSGGEILTNNHVIRGATSIRVEIDGRGTYDAEVIGADPTDDVALLQVQSVSGLPTISTDTSDLNVGDTVVAIGNAYGQGSNSATTGNITALDQDITAGDPGAAPEQLSGLIQTDAPIAPGDSGGALVDPQGEVIGMITAATRTTSFSRTSTEGYAITIGDALSIVNQIRSGEENGNIIIGRPGLLGVQVGDLNNRAAARLGIGTNDGALIIDVVPGTPADGAGITAGSAVTEINGNPIGSASDLSDVMRVTEPGQQASVSWIDTSGSHSATVQLITGPAV